MREVAKVIMINIAIGLLMAWPVAYFTSYTYFSSMFGILSILWLLGVIATYEDAMPGGYDNFDGEEPMELAGGLKKAKYILFSVLIVGSLLFLSICFGKMGL